MLNKIFISDVRVKILKLLLLNPEKSFHVRAIVRSVGAEINAIRRELDNLFSIGLLTKRQSSNKIFYKVDVLHPFFNDLLSLVSKEDGLSAQILNNLKKIGDVEFAVLSLAFLRGRTSSVLDVDLFLVGEPNPDIIEKLVKEEESRIGKEINYAIMKSEEFLSRKRMGDQFVMRILSQSRTMVVGDEEKFCSLV